MPKTILEVEDLTTYYKILRGYVKAVEDVTFHIDEREALGLAGESGCGKTTIALSLLKILPPGGFIKSGEIRLGGLNLVPLDEYEMRKSIRWKKISIVFQGAMNALNPVYKISDQIKEAILTHEPGTSESDASERGRKLFELVGIEPSRIDNYPHEFSGGMRQRAMIAMALACNPELLIADEPGTALDVIVQAQILKLINQLKEKLQLSTMLITHDLSIISETCDKVIIMYAGKIAEFADVVSVFKKPLHPYTQGLIKAFPDITGPRRHMESIPGSPPDLLNPPTGCRFHPRCRYAMNTCKTKEPEFLSVKEEHYVACHLFSKA